MEPFLHCTTGLWWPPEAPSRLRWSLSGDTSNGCDAQSRHRRDFRHPVRSGYIQLYAQVTDAFSLPIPPPRPSHQDQKSNKLSNCFNNQTRCENGNRCQQPLFTSSFFGSPSFSNVAPKFRCGTIRSTYSGKNGRHCLTLPLPRPTLRIHGSPTSRGISATSLGRAPMLVSVRPSNEITDDPSKLTRSLFRDEG